jgi:AcrR family transcriptional regulator
VTRQQSNTKGRRERRRARDREQVLAAAAAVFADHGYSDAGMAEIAAVAGCSVGKLYTLFENKESLFVSLVSDRLRSLNETSAEATDPNAPPLTRLRQRLRAALDYFGADPHFSRIFRTEYPDTADGLLQRESDRHSQIIRGYLAEAMDAGEIPREDPEALAVLSYSVIYGLIDLAALRDEPLHTDWVMGYVDRFFLGPLERREPAREAG